MKSLPLKFLAPLGVSVLFASNTYATLIASDSFTTVGADAYVDDRLYGQSPTTGTNGFSGDTAWNGNFNTGDVVIDSTGLSASLAVAPTGSSVITGGASSDRTVSRTFSSFTPTDETYYYSFLVYVNTGGTSNRSAFGLAVQDLSANYSDPQTGVMVSLEGASGTAGAYSDLNLWVAGVSYDFSADLATGSTYYALVQIDNSTTGDDLITANLYASTATDFSNSLSTASATGEISSQLSSLTVLQDFGGTGTLFDEFYLGTALSDVSSTVIPEPSAFALFAGFLIFGVSLARRRRS